MDIDKMAEVIAINAHEGSVRKSSTEKPYIVHPIDVANKLRGYGFDKEVVAAGYLHDVVEDTSYVDLKDIRRMFGKKVESYVRGATETSKIDKSIPKEKLPSWNERKKETIERTRNLSLQHKAVVCADKISNLEDMALLFRKNGEINFGSFNRGFDEQKWYYENIYQSLIYGNSEDTAMFKDLKDLINKVFYDYAGKKFDYNERMQARREEIIKVNSLFQVNADYTNKVSLIGNDEEYLAILKRYLENVGIAVSDNCLINACFLLRIDKDKLLLNTFFNDLSYRYSHKINDDRQDKERLMKEILEDVLQDMYDTSLSDFNKEIKKLKRIKLK